MKRVYTILFLVLLFYPIRGIFSQDIDLSYYSTTYPLEDLIELDNKSKYKIKLNNDVVTVHEENYERRLYLNEIATRFNSGSVRYDSFEIVTDIKAETGIRNSSGKYTNRKVSEFETKDVLVNGIFYGGYKSKSFFFPAISVGSYTELSYKKDILNPRFLNPFTFNAYIKIINAELIIETDKNIELGYQLYGEYANEVKYEKRSLRRGRTQHIWKTNNLPKIPDENNSLNSSYHRTHIIPFIEYYIKENGDTVRIAGSVDDLYSWYTGLVGSIKEPFDSLYVDKALAIKRNSSNQIELVQNIYKWVQENIDYIAFEDGYGGFIPRSATNVYRRKYGDCKDMAFLLKQMLRSVGIDEVYLAWVGTRDRPYSYRMLPTPMVDNHMITLVSTEEGDVYLDATNAYTPYGLPSSFIQGKEVLVGIDEQSYRLQNVPIVEKGRNRQIDSIYVHIEGEILRGSNKRILTGYRKVDADYALANVSPSEFDEFFDDYLSKGSNKFTVTEIDYSNLLNKREEASVLEYSFEIPDYVKSIRTKIYINPSFERTFIDKFEDIAKRELEYVEDYRFHDVVVTTILVPEGYEIDYIPENIEEDHGLFGFKATYSSDEQIVQIKSELYHDFLVLEQEHFNTYEQFLDVIAQNYQESISFKQISTN